jgi:hypothetical protein
LNQAQAKIDADIGPINDMIHFKMYGSLPGQTFHEKWQSSTANQVTLRIRGSLENIRAKKLRASISIRQRLNSALTQNYIDPIIDTRLTTYRTLVDGALATYQQDINNAVSIAQVIQGTEDINIVKRNVVTELSSCLTALLPGTPPAANLTALIAQINVEINNHSIGLRVRHRDAARTLKNSLQALLNAANGINLVQTL